ncbi:hypothetical protein [Pseudomonas sp. R4-35-07]|uniref:hypothetical protein n=2 Tax=unclassified Pseudomonas TaxID=196821 RepID=UPI000F55ECF1|nr:hypothetical protein [Pseudomonas sp. R4-35-07]
MQALVVSAIRTITRTIGGGQHSTRYAFGHLSTAISRHAVRDTKGAKMLSGKIKVTFEVPDESEAEDGIRPFISLDAMDLVDAAIESGLPDYSPLVGLIHEAGEDLDFQELLEAHLSSWVPEDRPAAADAIADWLEYLARLIRKQNEHLSLDLKPRPSPGPRY